MKRFVVILALWAALFSCWTAAAAGPLEDAAAIRAQWAEAFNAHDWDRIVTLYTADALFYGSKAPLFVGQEGVRTYFDHIPPGLTARMGEQTVVSVGPDVVLSSGLVDFIRPDGIAVPYRWTLALVRVGGRWMIAQHHTSPVPKS
jgi:uncharacterized protein (TIGR02246 family)